MRVTIYSKAECHLCDDMKDIVRRVAAGRAGITIDEIDISNDPALLERYGLEIPVLLIDGKKFAKYRVGEMELRRRLRGET